MAGFTESALQEKLSQLNNTLPSIQTLSLWLLHHRKHSANIVKVWYSEIKKEKQPKRILNLIHLANDVIQNARKKWPLFQEQFQEVLEKAFVHAARYADSSILTSLQRVLDVWCQRDVFSEEYLDKLIYALTSNLTTDMLSLYNKNAENSKTAPSATKKSKTGAKQPLNVLSPRPAAKRRRTPDDLRQTRTAARNGNGGDDVTPAMSAPDVDAAETPLFDERPGAANAPETDESAAAAADAAVSTEQRLIQLRSPEDVIAQAPKTDELMKALRILERPASADVETRQRIAQFPSDIADASKLSTLTTRFQAERFSQVVAEADQVLKLYNQRLSDEMSTRACTLDQLQKYTQAQKCLLAKDTQLLAEHKSKLAKLAEERLDLHHHVESLPDLSKLPDFTRLPPLPSAGDLFLK